MEKLIYSAIFFYPKGSEYPQIICGKRHSDCYEQMFKQKIEYDKIRVIQGFLTTNWRFVDRYEAMDIAIAANQLITTPEYKELFSEDVW